MVSYSSYKEGDQGNNMKHLFDVKGYFYEYNDIPLRKYLNIRNKGDASDKPDLMVIMMNPGSSQPVNGNDNNQLETHAIPDPTQDQIMKVMMNCNFNYARILNLSDLREPDSNIFYSKIKELNSNNIPHSIFDDDRVQEFNDLFEYGIPVIFAWGVNKKLKNLAEQAIYRVGECSPIGILKDESTWAYYHPLPPNYNHQTRWVETITSQLQQDYISVSPL